MYKHGVNLNDMRISNLHHETSIQALLLVQEIEPATWNRIADRVAGSNTIKHLKGDAFKCPKELPYMFEDWKEYGEYLADKLIDKDIYKEQLRKRIEKLEKFMINDIVKTDIYKTVIKTILSSDWDFTKMINFTTNPYFQAIKHYVNGTLTDENIAINKKYDKYLKGLI